MLCCVAAARQNEEAQRGDSDAIAWRQRRYSVAAARHNPTLIITAGLQQGNVAPCRVFQKIPERVDQKRNTTARAKRDTMTGALTQSSHRILGLPRLHFPYTFCTSALFANFHLPFFPRIRPISAYSFLSFFFKLSIAPTSTLSLSILFLSALFTPTLLLIQLFSQTCTFICCFSVIAIVSKPNMYAGITCMYVSHQHVDFPPSVFPGCHPTSFGVRVAIPTISASPK